MEIHQIIANLVMKLNLENLIVKQIVAYVKRNIMMMDALNYANFVLILGN